MLIELGGVTLLTDPVLRRRVLHLHRPSPEPEPPAAVDAVLISHLHYDHADLPSLRALRPPPPRLICPAGAGAFLARTGLGPPEELAPGEAVEVGGVGVHATYADHAGGRRPGGPSALAVGFLLRGERSIYFAGDTEIFDGMAALAPIDVALLPVAGLGPATRDRPPRPRACGAGGGPVTSAHCSADPLGHLPAALDRGRAVVPRPAARVRRPRGRARARRGRPRADSGWVASAVARAPAPSSPAWGEDRGSN